MCTICTSNVSCGSVEIVSGATGGGFDIACDESLRHWRACVKGTVSVGIVE